MRGSKTPEEIDLKEVIANEDDLGNSTIEHVGNSELDDSEKVSCDVLTSGKIEDYIVLEQDYRSVDRSDIETVINHSNNDLSNKQNEFWGTSHLRVRWNSKTSQIQN